MANPPEEELFELERQFWTGDSQFYEGNLDDRCVIAFAQMSGVMTKQEIAATIGSGSRWRNLQLTRKGFLEPSPGVALLVYEAKATRENGEDYSALVGSGYVRRESGWKMMFHQQTPLASGG